MGDTGTISAELDAVSETSNIMNTHTSVSNVEETDSNLGEVEVVNIMAQGRLEMSGVLAVPQGDLYEALREDKPVVFYWSIKPLYSGLLKGSIWVNLLTVNPDDKIGLGQSEGMRTPLTMQNIEIQALDLLGIRGPTARLLGSLGIILGAVSGLDGVFHAMINWVTKETEYSDA